MTEDPYRLNDDLQISAVPASDLDDEYDGLESEIHDTPKRTVKKMPIVLGLMLVVFASGASYIAYQMFVADVAPLAPAQPPIMMQQPPVAQDMPAGVDVLPQDDMAGQPDGMMNPADALADMPPAVEGEEGAVPDAAADASTPVDENATHAEALLPPDESELNAEGETVAAEPSAEGAAEASAETDAVPSVEAPADVASPVQEDPNAMPPAMVEAMRDADATATTTDAASGALGAAASENAGLLKPIDPVVPHPAPATTAAAPAMPAPKAVPALPLVPAAAATMSKNERTMAEVQQILGGTGEAAVARQQAQAAAAAPVDVTPRAREVIVVKRSHSAQSPQAMVAAGDRVLAADQYQAAVDIYNTQLRNNPSDPLALAGKALALQKAGNDVEAMNTYDRLLSLNPRDVEAMTNYLGLLQKQDPQQALNRLQILSEQYPQNSEVAGQLGMLYARMMDTPNALRHFQKAAALDPTNATYPFNRAVLYDRLGSASKARVEYQRALNIARNYPNKSSVSLDAIRQRLGTLAN